MFGRLHEGLEARRDAPLEIAAAEARADGLGDDPGRDRIGQ